MNRDYIFLSVLGFVFLGAMGMGASGFWFHRPPPVQVSSVPVPPHVQVAKALPQMVPEIIVRPAAAPKVTTIEEDLITARKSALALREAVYVRLAALGHPVTEAQECQGRGLAPGCLSRAGGDEGRQGGSQ